MNLKTFNAPTLLPTMPGCTPQNPCGVPYNIFMKDLFYMGGGSGSLFDPAYQAVIDYALTQGFTLPSMAVMNIQNTLVIDLKASGIWNDLDVYYNFVTDGDRDFACINWKAPGTFTAVRNGGILFRPFDGFEGNGTNAFLDTNYIPTGLANYKDADASFGFALSNIVGSGNSGSRNTGGNISGAFLGNIGVAGGQYVFVINTSNALFIQAAAPTEPRQFWLGQRNSSGFRTFVNGAIRHTSSSTASATIFDVYSFKLLAQDTNGNLGGFMDATIGTAWLGASLSGKEAALYNDWATYVSSMALVAYSPEYVAILQYAVSQGFAIPSANVRQYQDQLLRALIGNGIWDELDVFYNFLTDGDANFALINWKNPGTHQATTVNGPTYTPLSGFSGTGTQYLNSNYIVVDENICVFGEQDSVNVNSGCLFGVGVANTSRTIRLFPRTSNSIFYSVNDDLTSSLGGIGTSLGFWYIQRISNLIKQVFTNGFLRTSDNNSPTSAPPPFPVFILSSNMSGTPTNTMPSNITCFGIGSALQGREANLYNVWQTYKYLIQANTIHNAILDYAISQGFALPTYPVRNAARKLIANLLRTGIWDQLDVFYNFLTDGDADYAKINWKAPGTFQAVGGNAPFQPMIGIVGPADWTVMPPNQATIAQPENVASFIGIGNYQFAVDNITSGVSVNNEAVRARSATEVRLRVNTIYNSVGIPVQPGDDCFLMGQGLGTTGRFFNNGIEVGNVGGTPPGIEQGSFVINSGLGTVASLITQVYGRGASLQGSEADLYNSWHAYKINIEQIAITF